LEPPLFLVNTAKRSFFFLLLLLNILDMSTIATKIKHPSTTHLLLFKEGVFWVVYEQSAYFKAELKKYKPTKKYFKNINKTVVFIGFPNANDLINNLDVVQDEMKQSGC
jgi:hypothetical protein